MMASLFSGFGFAPCRLPGGGHSIAAAFVGRRPMRFWADISHQQLATQLLAIKVYSWRHSFPTVVACASSLAVPFQSAGFARGHTFGVKDAGRPHQDTSYLQLVLQCVTSLALNLQVLWLRRLRASWATSPSQCWRRSLGNVGEASPRL